MKTNKKTFFALTAIFALFVIMIFASALQDTNGNIVLGIWYDSDANANTMTIADGDEIDFNVYALAVGSDLDVEVKLVKPGDDVIFEVFERAYQDFNEFGLGTQGDYTVTKDEYGGVGNYTLRLRVTGDETDILKLYLNVVEDEPEPENGAPIFTSSPVITVFEDEAYSYNAETDDPEGDTVIYSLTVNPGWLSINSNTGVVTATAASVPNVDSSTNYGVVITASDGVNSANQAFDITVLDSNNAPSITSIPDQQENENTAFTYPVVATDDGDDLTYSLSDAPTGFAISSSGLISGTTPDVTADTDYTITATVTDDGGLSDQEIFVLTVVSAEAGAPVVTITFPSNTLYDAQIGVLNYTAVDAEGNLDECWYSTNLGVTNSTPVDCSSGSGSFTINSVEGINRWTVYASDLSGNVGSAMITFTVDTDSDDGSSSSSSKDVSYIYEDPDQSKYETPSNVNPYINLAPSPESGKSFLIKFIEAIINFFRWVFS